MAREFCGETSSRWKTTDRQTEQCPQCQHHALSPVQQNWKHRASSFIGPAAAVRRSKPTHVDRFSRLEYYDMLTYGHHSRQQVCCHTFVGSPWTRPRKQGEDMVAHSLLCRSEMWQNTMLRGGKGLTQTNKRHKTSQPPTQDTTFT